MDRKLLNSYLYNIENLTGEVETFEVANAIMDLAMIVRYLNDRLEKLENERVLIG